MLLVSQTLGTLLQKQNWCNDVAYYPLLRPSEPFEGFRFAMHFLVFAIQRKDRLSSRRRFIVKMCYSCTQNRNKFCGC